MLSDGRARAIILLGFFKPEFGYVTFTVSFLSLDLFILDA